MPETTASNIFEAFNQVKALVIGDLMLDAYVKGKVERISPEAPVPVLHVSKREYRPGGAANVALNIKAMGATALLCGVVGTADAGAGQHLTSILAEAGLDTSGVVPLPHYVTTVKSRIMSGSHHLLRIDEEDPSPLSTESQELVFKKIQQLLPACQVVIMEDYDKGLFSPVFIQRIIALAQQHHVPTVVDPKKRNFLAFKGVTLFKPNLKELREGLNIEADPSSFHSISHAAQQLKDALNAQGVLITLSEHGMYINHEGQQLHTHAHLRNISDVSGAGDTVVSVAALALALNLPPKLILELANLAGGLVCEHAGVVPINKAQLQEEALRLQII